MVVRAICVNRESSIVNHYKDNSAKRILSLINYPCVLAPWRLYSSPFHKMKKPCGAGLNLVVFKRCTQVLKTGKQDIHA